MPSILSDLPAAVGGRSSPPHGDAVTGQLVSRPTEAACTRDIWLPGIQECIPTPPALTPEKIAMAKDGQATPTAVHAVFACIGKRSKPAWRSGAVASQKHGLGAPVLVFIFLLALIVLLYTFINAFGVRLWVKLNENLSHSSVFGQWE